MTKVDAAIAEAKTALDGTDIAAIKSAMEKLGVGVPGSGPGDLRGHPGRAGRGRWRTSRLAGPSDDNVVDAEVVDDDDQENK